MKKSLLLLLITATMAFPAISCGGPSGPTPGVTPPVTSSPGAGSNRSPVINKLSANPPSLKPDTISEIRCEATDPDGDVLTYSWSSDGGAFQSDVVSKQFWINWRAPKFTGNFNITVNVTDGRGGSTTKTYAMAVVTNRPPVISSIVVNPPIPKPNDTCTITANVTDPDGDTVTYAWLTNSGKIAGTGNVVTWIAPATDGVYSIQAVASDGLDGGTSNQTINITVQTPSNSVTLSQVVAESGTVSSSSDLSTAYYRAGDDATNNGLRAFFSFDLSGLAGGKVTSANLTFTVKQLNGSPFSLIPPNVYVESVVYGPRALKASDYDTPASSQIAKLDSKAPGEYVLTNTIADFASASTARYQIRIRMDSKTNTNGIADNLEFSGATLKITYQK